MYVLSKKYLLVEARINIFDWGIQKLFSVKIYTFHNTFQSLTNTFCTCNKYISLLDRVHWHWQIHFANTTNTSFSWTECTGWAARLLLGKDRGPQPSPCLHSLTKNTRTSPFFLTSIHLYNYSYSIFLHMYIYTYSYNVPFSLTLLHMTHQ